jgi:hypothetical protein
VISEFWSVEFDPAILGIALVGTVRLEKIYALQL